jgi:hypothetical protein
MSAWGNKDDIASPGRVDLTGLTVANTGGTATFFANNFSVGQVINIVGAGSAVIGAIAGEGSLTLISNTEITVGSVANAEYSVSEKPVVIVEGDGTVLATDVYGVDTTEAGVATANVAHAGWVLKGEKYTDADGNLRQKSEVLVAMSTITGDADDDANFPDS